MKYLVDRDDLGNAQGPDISAKARRLVAMLNVCGVPPKDGFIMFPVPSNTGIRLAGGSMMLEEIQTIKCKIDFNRKGKLFLVSCEEKHGYPIGKVFDPAPLLIATEMWRCFVTPVLDAKRKRKEEELKKQQQNGRTETDSGRG